MVDRIEVSIFPYVVAWPRSIAWMKEKVIAPVEVTLDKACKQKDLLGHSQSNLSLEVPTLNSQL